MTGARVAVSFLNRHGQRLVGVLHQPSRASSTGLVVLLLSPGVKMRVGPQRLYCRLAEKLVGMGLPVLRFDFHGLGDSQGDVNEELLRDVYNHIEVGRYVDDTIDAMNWMAREHGASRFVLGGLCGGAITGLLAAESDRRVAGLLALAITPVLASRAADPSLYMTSGQLADMRRTYLEKLLDPRSWLRLLSLKSDYRVIWRVLTHRPKPRPHDTAAEVAPPDNDNASPLFPPAFFAMLEGRRPLLLVFGGSDRLLWEFQEKFLDRHRARLAELPPLYDVHTIDAANHVLSLRHWEQEMHEHAERWLRQRFSVA